MGNRAGVAAVFCIIEPPLNLEAQSPVFSQTGWKIVALHHAGGDFMPKLNGKIGTYAANEGIGIRSIQDVLTSALG